MVWREDHCIKCTRRPAIDPECDPDIVGHYRSAGARARAENIHVIAVNSRKTRRTILTSNFARPRYHIPVASGMYRLSRQVCSMHTTRIICCVFPVEKPELAVRCSDLSNGTSGIRCLSEHYAAGGASLGARARRGDLVGSVAAVSRAGEPPLSSGGRTGFVNRDPGRAASRIPIGTGGVKGVYRMLHV